MKIGINLLYLIPGVVGGTETYAAGLLEGLRRTNTKHEFILFMNEESAEWPVPDSPSFRKVMCPIAASNRLRRYTFEQRRLPSIVREFGIDVVHSLGYTSPLFSPCPTVVTVPDLNFRAFGKTMSLHRRLALGFFVRQAVLHATKVITISEFSRREIMRTYHLPAAKIVVTYLAAELLPTRAIHAGDSSKKAPPSQITRPYLLAFSSRYPNKNIPNLIRAFLLLKKEHRLQHQLVLVGHEPSGGEFDEVMRSLKKEDGVLHTGYLDAEALASTVRDASVLVFPSYYEGFGLPVLEAMASGVPVVCSRAGALPEVAGNAAVYFEPFSVSDMAEKIASVALNADLGNDLRARGHENLARFSWESTATRTMDVYEEIAEISSH